MSITEFRRQPVQDEAGWAMASARTRWPDRRLDELVERTVTDIERTVGSKRAAFAWAGGRECQVLAHLAGLAGIHRCVLTITNLEYPATCAGSPTGCLPA